MRSSAEGGAGGPDIVGPDIEGGAGGPDIAGGTGGPDSEGGA